MSDETKTSQSGDTSSSAAQAYPLSKGEQLETLYKVAILGIVLAIFILAIDIWRDNSLHTRITEIERQVADYKIELSDKINKQQEQLDNLPKNNRIEKIENNIDTEKEILSCFKNKRYWQYEQCFK